MIRPWVRDEAEKRIGHLYPKVTITAETAKHQPDLKQYVGKELTVIAWLWARTVASPGPSRWRSRAARSLVLALDQEWKEGLDRTGLGPPPP